MLLKQNRILLGFLFLSAVIFIGITYYFVKLKIPSAEKISNTPTFIQELASRNSQPFLENYESELKKIQEDRSLERNIILVETMRFTFTSMNELSAHMNKESLRKKLLDDLLLKEESISIAMQTLTDSKFSKETFTKDQAVARIYSIQLLRHAADQGKIEPLEETAKHLSEVLARKENVRPGEWRDLEDLLDNVISVKGPKQIMENIDQFLTDLSFSEASSESFYKALYFSLYGVVPKGELESFLETSLKSF